MLCKALGEIPEDYIGERLHGTKVKPCPFIVVECTRMMFKNEFLDSCYEKQLATESGP